MFSGVGSEAPGSSEQNRSSDEREDWDAGKIRAEQQATDQRALPCQERSWRYSK